MRCEFKWILLFDCRPGVAWHFNYEETSVARRIRKKKPFNLKPLSWAITRATESEMRSDDERNHKSISIEGELENKIEGKFLTKVFLMRNVILMGDEEEENSFEVYFLSMTSTQANKKKLCLQKWLIFCTNSFMARRAAGTLCDWSY